MLNGSVIFKLASHIIRIQQLVSTMFENMKSQYDFHEIIYPDLDLSENLKIKIIRLSDLKFKEYFEIYRYLVRFAYERKMYMLAQKTLPSGEYGRGKRIQSITKVLTADEAEFKGLIGEITHILAIYDIFGIENIKFCFPKWLFGTSKSRGVDLIGCFCFDSEENGFIGESKFTSFSNKTVNIAESALKKAEDNIDRQAEDNINKFNNILRLLIRAKLFLQPIKLLSEDSESIPSFLKPILYLNRISHTELERRIERLFEKKENVKLLIHVISPSISTMKLEDLSFEDVSIICQSLVTCMDCKNEMINLDLLEGES